MKGFDLDLEAEECIPILVGGILLTGLIYIVIRRVDKIEKDLGIKSEDSEKVGKIIKNLENDSYFLDLFKKYANYNFEKFFTTNPFVAPVVKEFGDFFLEDITSKKLHKYRLEIFKYIMCNKLKSDFYVLVLIKSFFIGLIQNKAFKWDEIQKKLYKMPTGYNEVVFSSDVSKNRALKDVLISDGKTQIETLKLRLKVDVDVK
ncbi:hypothetical protein EDEG_00878 [Edhazardia aedis USNM 41457]|uniref:Uncharacterized protein n=1 Tax=Edhazardia aedis (strain USNM 41457) TaxID=1003232 RepID=J9DR20_EDHAE|nr:hypothetical protein EDEG_00878 [Edhazardia aedis USNM 41457]|eukprot:EJW05025.1 hypothetical protein EDEG_00878 [Edhazardia aedis USNM 41457]